MRFLAGGLFIFCSVLCGAIGTGYMLSAAYAPSRTAALEVNPDQIDGSPATAGEPSPWVGQKPNTQIALGVLLVCLSAGQLVAALLWVFRRGRGYCIVVTALSGIVLLAVPLVDRWTPTVAFALVALAVVLALVVKTTGSLKSV